MASPNKSRIKTSITEKNMNPRQPAHLMSDQRGAEGLEVLSTRKDTQIGWHRKVQTVRRAGESTKLMKSYAQVDVAVCVHTNNTQYICQDPPEASG
jgi:hypothetical protein